MCNCTTALSHFSCDFVVSELNYSTATQPFCNLIGITSVTSGYYDVMCIPSIGDALRTSDSFMIGVLIRIVCFFYSFQVWPKAQWSFCPVALQKRTAGILWADKKACGLQKDKGPSNTNNELNQHWLEAFVLAIEYFIISKSKYIREIIIEIL